MKGTGVNSDDKPDLFGVPGPLAIDEPQTAPQTHLRSMTGYAQARLLEGGRGIRIALRAVNHRFLDLHVRVAEGFEPLEPRIRQIIRERIRRGHLDVTLHSEIAATAAVGINQELAGAYLQAAEALRSQFDLKSEPDIASILRLPGVVAPAGNLDEDLAHLEPAVAQCLAHALDTLDAMRAKEAAHLAQEMAQHLDAISDLVAAVEPLLERARPLFAQRLQSRLQELLGEAGIDPARLAQEAAIAAARSDVAEELARLRSHVQQFRSVLAGAVDAGKKLDFLLQEMQREANTLLSKTPGTDREGLEITRAGLEIKSQVEKLREQVQNIE